MKKILSTILILFSVVVNAQTPMKEINNDLLIKGCVDGYFPFASLIDTTDQTTSSATASYPITFNVNDTLRGISHTVGDSNITFNCSGIFLISFSGIFSSSAPNKVFNVWIRHNHVDVPMSNTTFQLLGTSTDRVVTVTYILPFEIGDVMTLAFSSNDTGGKLDYTTKQTSPTRPVCPSIILTINKISK